MVECKPRIIGTLVGDISREPSARTKYALFFKALARHYPLVGICDASLRGFDRFVNALRTIHPNQQRWRERFYKNTSAFYLRSRRVSQYIKSIQEEADLILQVGVLFDSRWDGVKLPSVIYTDYTAHLAAQKPLVGRSPFNDDERHHWITLERRSFERAIHICTRSRLVAGSVINDYGIEPERVTVVGGGINFPSLPKLPSRPERKEPIALFIGKELYRKGGDLLLHAFAQVRQAVPNARLLMLTHDPVPLDLPLEGVEVIAPTWERERIASLYRQADLLVLPSRLETWGDVLLEAMSYGLPCIGVAGQSMEEIIAHERTGLIVPPEDASALAAALSRMFKNSTLRRQWGQSARQWAEAEFTWDRVVERAAPAIEAAAAVSASKRKAP